MRRPPPCSPPDQRGRRAKIPADRTKKTRSPCSLKSSPSVPTVPRSACFDDGFTEVMVTLPQRRSPPLGLEPAHLVHAGRSEGRGLLQQTPHEQAHVHGSGV